MTAVSTTGPRVPPPDIVSGANDSGTTSPHSRNDNVPSNSAASSISSTSRETRSWTEFSQQNMSISMGPVVHSAGSTGWIRTD